MKDCDGTCLKLSTACHSRCPDEMLLCGQDQCKSDYQQCDGKCNSQTDFVVRPKQTFVIIFWNRLKTFM